MTIVSCRIYQKRQSDTSALTVAVPPLCGPVSAHEWRRKTVRPARPNNCLCVFRGFLTPVLTSNGVFFRHPGRDLCPLRRSYITHGGDGWGVSHPLCSRMAESAKSSLCTCEQCDVNRGSTTMGNARICHWIGLGKRQESSVFHTLSYRRGQGYRLRHCVPDTCGDN